MTEPVDLTADNFAATQTGTWLVDFWAEWCGPCRAMDPVLKELAAEREDARIGKVEISAFPDLATQYGVTSVPTLIVFRDGERVQTLHGAKNKRQLARSLDEANGLTE